MRKSLLQRCLIVSLLHSSGIVCHRIETSFRLELIKKSLLISDWLVPGIELGLSRRLKVTGLI